MATPKAETLAAVAAMMKGPGWEFCQGLKLHILHYLEGQGIYRSADGSDVYCRPEFETGVKIYLEELHHDIAFGALDVSGAFELIIKKWPHA